MILVISTESNEQFSVGLADGLGLQKIKTVNKRFQLSELLLKTIQQLVGADLNVLEKIIVVKGPGAFSSLRTGISVANTLAYSLKILVVGVLLEQEFSNQEDKLVWLFEKGGSLKGGAMVVPEYGREPNIG